MGYPVSPSGDEPDNRTAPPIAAELPTEIDNDAAPALGASPNKEREPAARHTCADVPLRNYSLPYSDFITPTICNTITLLTSGTAQNFPDV